VLRKFDSERHFMKHLFGRTIAKALLVGTLLGTASVASVANAAVGVFPSQHLTI
jgi:hypothetical protein